MFYLFDAFSAVCMCGFMVYGAREDGRMLTLCVCVWVSGNAMQNVQYFTDASV